MNQNECMLFILDEIDGWLSLLGNIMHSNPNLDEYIPLASKLRTAFTELNEALKSVLVLNSVPPVA